MRGAVAGRVFHRWIECASRITYNYATLHGLINDMPLETICRYPRVWTICIECTPERREPDRGDGASNVQGQPEAERPEWECRDARVPRSEEKRRMRDLQEPACDRLDARWSVSV